MKKIEKVFWVTEGSVKCLKGEKHDPFSIVLFFEKGKHCITKNPDYVPTNKITISWEEPYKKAEITEKDFWEIVESVSHYGETAKLKQKLFGEKND